MQPVVSAGIYCLVIHSIVNNLITNNTCINNFKTPMLAGKWNFSWYTVCKLYQPSQLSKGISDKSSLT